MSRENAFYAQEAMKATHTLLSSAPFGRTIWTRHLIPLVDVTLETSF